MGKAQHEGLGAQDHVWSQDHSWTSKEMGSPFLRISPSKTRNCSTISLLPEEYGSVAHGWGPELQVHRREPQLQLPGRDYKSSRFIGEDQSSSSRNGGTIPGDHSSRFSRGNHSSRLTGGNQAPGSQEGHHFSYAYRFPFSISLPI